MVEENAKLCKDMARSMASMEELRNPFWKPEENIEMLTRYMVRDGFADLVGTKVSAGELEALEEALFNVIYPTAS
jgi:hypothetical protein